MNAKRRLAITLLFLSMLMVAGGPLWANAVEAAPPQSNVLQPPPPEPPSEPPPGSGNVPYMPPAESIPEDESEDTEYYILPPQEPVPEEADSVPAMPSQAPALPALPDPSNVEEGEGVFQLAPGAGMGGGSAILMMPAFGFGVYVDRGCGAVYEVGESIEFSVSADWDVANPAIDHWRYLEVWGSTHGAWWHQVIRGQWIEPRDSVSRAGFVGRPVGNELLYARLLDQSGFVLDEATCVFTSEEVVAPPAPPVEEWIGCGETYSAYVNAGDEHVWSFAGRTGQRVTITMLGDFGFDTYLELYDPEGRLMQENDDISRANTNSRIRMNLPRRGVYSIVARGYDYREGGYQLTINCR